jgi:hypothetical protein
MWIFPVGPCAGAKVYLAHLYDERDASNYHGWSLRFIGIDEAGDFNSLAPILLLFGSLRSAHGVNVQLCLTGNPGGPCHGELKARYVDPCPEGFKIIVR